MRLLPRRDVLAGAGLAGAGGFLVGGASSAPQSGEPPPRPAQPARTGLNARAQAKGLFFGTAIDHTILRTDPVYMQHVQDECGLVVAEATFKWDYLQPAPGKFAFEPADMLAAYAARHGLRIRGHTLTWHLANPKWLETDLTPANGERLLTTYIATVVGHFRKRMVHWDVVNEPILTGDKNKFGLRNNLWFRALGPRYIDIAFHACAAADPSSLRVLNEFGIDYAKPFDEARRHALLDLLADLKARNVPIQAVGLQGHLDASETAFDPKILSKFVADITGMGLKVIVTELDVRDDRLPADIDSRDTAVADQARAWLDAVLVNPGVLGVISWGLSDRRSWLNEVFPRPDKLPQRPLPLDTELRRKKLWAAIGAALDIAPSRAAHG